MRNSFIIAGMSLASTAFSSHAADYLVAVPANCDASWHKVATALAAKHRGEVVKYDGDAASLLTPLKASRPHYLAVVGPASTFQAHFVRSINRISRQVDTDPYADVRWGLVSGHTPEAAMRIVNLKQPLVIHRALTTTGIDLNLVDTCLTLSDGVKGNYTVKKAGANPEDKSWDEKKTPAGTVSYFDSAWKTTDPQLIVTSSHATQFNLEMPFGLGLIASHGGKFHIISQQDRNEFAKFLGGAMFTGDPAKLGEWIESKKFPTLTPSDTPKVWVAAGNCLIGDAKGTNDSMVITAMGSAGVRQFVGYVVPTWFGRAGWGTLGLWQQSCGQLSLSEAFFLNDCRVIDETITRYPKAMSVVFDADDIQSCMKSDVSFLNALKKLTQEGVKVDKDCLGLIHDRDVLALWGDPAWEARFDPTRKPHALEWKWIQRKDEQELRITAREAFEGTLELYLPQRLDQAPTVTATKEIKVLAADDFILLRSFKLAKGESAKVTLTPNAQ